MVIWFENTFKNRQRQISQEAIPNPHFLDTFKYARPDVLLYATAWTTVGSLGGYVFGKPLRTYCAMFSGVMTAVAGAIMIHRVTYQRLTGFRENDIELKKLGIPKREIAEIIAKRPVIPEQELMKNI